MRARRLVTVAAAVLVALALAVLFLLSQPLRGAGVREAVEQRLTALLGQPVTIGDLDVDFFPALSVSGTAVRIGDTEDEAPAVHVHRVVIYPRVAALVRGDVAVRDVLLEGLVLSVLREADGRWGMPTIVPAPTAQQSAGATIARVRVRDGRLRIFDVAPIAGTIRETTSVDSIDTTMVLDEDGLRFEPIRGRIGSADVTGEARTDPKAVRFEFTATEIGDDDLPALLRLIGSGRPEFLRLAEVAAVTADMRVDRESSVLTGSGTVRAPQVLLGPVRLENFEAPFTVTGRLLDFKPTTFGLYGGTHTGSVAVSLAERPRWTIDSRVEGMDVGAFLDAVGGGEQRVDGTGTVSAALSGWVDEPVVEGASGRVQLAIRNGIIRDFPLLAFIDRTLRLTEQAQGDTTFERLTATFDVAGGRATTNDLLIEADHARVAAEGDVAASGALDMRGVLILSPERSRAAIASVRELSGVRNASGEVEVPLTIEGSLDAPSFALDLKEAVGKGIRDELRRRLLGIIKR